MGTTVEWSDLTAQIILDKLAEENARVKVGLDNVTTNVMIADNDLRIVYINKSLNDMLQRSETAIQKDVPAFRITGLMGRCVDDFHKEPSYQRGMIKKISTTYTTQLKLGGLIFELVVNPVVDDKGERLGTTVEWAEITEKMEDERRQAEASRLIEEESSVL